VAWLADPPDARRRRRRHQDPQAVAFLAPSSAAVAALGISQSLAVALAATGLTLPMSW
jgi:hypothetical protein